MWEPRECTDEEIFGLIGKNVTFKTMGMKNKPVTLNCKVVGANPKKGITATATKTHNFKEWSIPVNDEVICVNTEYDEMTRKTIDGVASCLIDNDMHISIENAEKIYAYEGVGEYNAAGGMADCAFD